MNLHELKKEKENRMTQIMNDAGVFWAFSNEQFHANKTPLQEGEKYVRLGMGGYCPKSKVDDYLNGLESLQTWFNDEIKNNDLRRQQIVYELSNHEAWYTYDIEDTLAALGPDYTREEVSIIFHQERENQLA